MPPCHCSPPVTNRLLAWAFDRGVIDSTVALRRNVLPVLCYHRIGSADGISKTGFAPNFSASPDNFEQQIVYLCKHLSPISASDLKQFIEGRRRLPPHPVLITFDDGYKDNATIAWPVLRKRGIPAIVFVATDHIGNNRPFVWDFVAYCFQTTTCTNANIPFLGETILETTASRNAAAEAWVVRSKTRPASEQWPAAEALRKSLSVEVADSTFCGLYLSWDDVRSLAAEGVEFGGHTRTHPILSKTSPAHARAEITGCYERLEAELGKPPIAFAYPNGSASDFGREHQRAVSDSGFSMAFSLSPGPSSFHEVRRNPMAIRRIHIGLHDCLPRFAAKLSGAYRWLHAVAGR